MIPRVPKKQSPVSAYLVSVSILIRQVISETAGLIVRFCMYITNFMYVAG